MDQPSQNFGINWKNLEVVKTFLQTCVQEVSINGRQCVSLRPNSWNKVKIVLEETRSVTFSQKQCKNYYDYLKEKYQVWLSITQKTGNVYDPATNTINMKNIEWDEYIKAHPKAAKL
ncbi:Myb_DNA-bind_3 domain-containing protein [Cephalotus follicularis]|uniref:Myb_DNA-bind_3 domain-containing protein n=1 Tax=Cephalotus follicularis TaxID=3775 RepID=A0A1Q3AZW5_CEPFO|nr:Myb_DNA-bind_3 domain-containing protein [Cephalotus follicularis]